MFIQLNKINKLQRKISFNLRVVSRAKNEDGAKDNNLSLLLILKVL